MGGLRVRLWVRVRVRVSDIVRDMSTRISTGRVRVTVMVRVTVIARVRDMGKTTVMIKGCRQ